jgi:diketogulonate reductase-like aldo/keto reductase
MKGLIKILQEDTNDKAINSMVKYLKMVIPDVQRWGVNYHFRIHPGDRNYIIDYDTISDSVNYLGELRELLEKLYGVEMVRTIGVSNIAIQFAREKVKDMDNDDELIIESVEDKVLNSMVKYLGTFIKDIKEVNDNYYFIENPGNKSAELRYEINTKKVYYWYVLVEQIVKIYGEELVKSVGVRNIIEKYVEDTLKVEVYDTSPLPFKGHTMLKIPDN